MRRRDLLRLAPAAAAAPLLASLARASSPADPVLRAVLELGGRVRYWPRDSTKHYVAWVENRAGAIVGYISARGKFDAVTTSWPKQR